MVERHLPKVNVASSNLVFRSMKNASFYEAFFFSHKNNSLLQHGCYSAYQYATFVIMSPPDILLILI